MNSEDGLYCLFLRPLTIVGHSLSLQFFPTNCLRVNKLVLDSVKKLADSKSSQILQR